MPEYTEKLVSILQFLPLGGQNCKIKCFFGSFFTKERTNY